ncbi:Zein-binding domain [Macleaya cordata]|uniref:Zein-binding domain n=1 Tax=Macleaya cordata TaxID=56857 RepID=A0A200Q856_MACCD|nr:Zein-binding domain [Macleaya cordata]
MAESSICSSSTGRTEIVSLKEALRTQQKLLQKLYVELEEEREASATAASEALSMILRLQEEKAAEKMEATQYKRMAEEKMHHVERSLLLVKELMYQKEMEVASLEFQVQSYRYKMLSMGFSDLVITEMRFGENRLLQQNETRYGDFDVHGSVRRNNSLPATPFKNKATVEIDGSVIPLEELSPNKIDVESHREVDVSSEEINSYWKQIKQLDERVEELSHSRDADRGHASSSQGPLSTIAVYSASLKTRSRSCSLEPEVDRDVFTEPTIEPVDTANKLEFDASSVTSRETEEIRDAPDSIGVHDVFEVPQNHEISKICGSLKKEEKKLIMKGETTPDSDSKGTLDCNFKEEAEPVNKGVLFAHPKTKFPRPIDGIAIDCNLAVRGTEIGIAQSQAEVQYLSKRLEQLEGQRKYFNQDVFDRREEELRLLREINEKLDMVQSELRSSRTKKCPPRDDPSLDSVTEVIPIDCFLHYIIHI